MATQDGEAAYQAAVRRALAMMNTPAEREALQSKWYLISVHMRVGGMALEVDGLSGPADLDRLAQIEVEAADIRRDYPDSLKAHPERERAEAEAAGRFRGLAVAVQNARARLGLALAQEFV